MTIGIFETTETIGQALIIDLNNFLDSFDLRKKSLHLLKMRGLI
jgi:hypothetical protein